MTSKRRREYLPIESNPVYHKEYNRLRVASKTLNGVFNDELSIKHAILLLTGNAEGFYYKDHQKQIARLPYIKQRIKDIESEFKRFQRSKINLGYEKPLIMPTDLQNEKYLAEASLDVLTEELEHLEQQLKMCADQAQEDRSGSVLRHGLRCSGSFHGIGTSDYDPRRARAILDGQYISQLPDGMLIVDDSSSIYDGISVQDYRKLSKEWLKKISDDDDELLKKIQTEARQKGETIPWATGRLGNFVVDKKSLPPFPEWAKNYKKADIKADDIKETKRNKK